MKQKQCKCGCGTKIPAFDKYGREKFYVIYHNFKDPKFKKAQIKRQKGKKPAGLTFKGKKHTRESIEKTRAYFTGRPKSKEHRKNISIARIGKYRGAKSPTWKGGISSLYEGIRLLFEYRQWRSDVFTRDKFTCKHCGDNTGHNLNAHHIKHLKDIVDEYKIKTLDQARSCQELWNINNGITLCQECHKQEHKNSV